MVENAPAQFFLGPGNHRHVRLGQITQPGKGLVAIARGVEEIDGVAPGNAVTLGRDINLDLVHGHDVGGLEHIIPAV